MVFWKYRILHDSTALIQSRLSLFVVHVRDTLVIENRRYIVLEVILTHRPAQNITCLEQKVVQVLYTFQFQLLGCLGAIG